MASYQCDRCLKRFSSYYNVRRHKANHCAYAKIDDNVSMEGGGSSYSDEQSVDSFPDEESVTETEEDENSENSEDDGEIKEEIDPWATMIDDAKATVRPEYDEFMKTLQMDGQEESAAKQEAFESVLPELQKEFANIYVDNLRWMKALKNDPVHRKIMETKETFANEDSFDPDEALSAAVDKRKFLLKQLLEDQGRFSDSDESM